MQVIGFTAPGGPEVLETFEVQEPTLGPGQVVIAVRAATVNPSDVVTRSGQMHDRYAAVHPPYIPGWDAAGVVVDADPATGWVSGDEVIAITLPVLEGGGAYAEQIAVDAASVVRKPPHLSFAAAATIPMNGLTALLALDAAALAAGDTLAVTGSAGAVGGYVVELAAARGIEVYADAAERDEALVAGFGAQHVLPRGPRFAAAVREAVSHGVDGLIDTALQRDSVTSAIRDGGVFVGLRAAQAGGGITDAHTIRQEYPVVAAAIGDHDRLQELVDLAATGKLTTRVADEVPAAEAAAAHRQLEAGGLRGRLVLRF